MSRIFVTSDTHFGHANIIRYANRPFRTWSDMGESMIERWNNRVAIDDVVYFLGDFAMGPGATLEYILNVLRRLNGSKIGILGNHDQPSKYSMGLKAAITDEIFNFEVINEQIHEIRRDGRAFVMCHYPMVDWNGKYHGAIHLHGHIHTQYTAKAAYDMKEAGRYDIGVDMYGGPVQITSDLRYLNSPEGWV